MRHILVEVWGGNYQLYCVELDDNDEVNWWGNVYASNHSCTNTYTQDDNKFPYDEILGETEFEEILCSKMMHRNGINYNLSFDGELKADV